MKKNLFIGDNLPVLRNMQSKSVDLIYLDPPFNSGKQWGNPIKAEGRKAEVAFKDTWSLGDIHADEELELRHYAKDVIPLINSLFTINGGSWKAYLIYMGIRLAEMHRVLKDTGSIYYHCDPTMSHGVKLIMDCIFGKANFRNEIVWHYGGRGGKAVSKQFPRNGDVILFYTKSGETAINKQTYTVKIPIKDSGYKVDTEGRYFRTSPRGNYTDESIQQLEKEGRIYRTSNGTIRIKYYEKSDDEFIYEEKVIGNVWSDIADAMHLPQKERTGYPTQKPLKLLERIINASSNKGDIVLDPFCGCATTCVAANNLERSWIGVDLSDKAEHFIKSRIRKESFELVEGTFELNPKQEPRTDYQKPDKNTVKAELFAQSKICIGCDKEKILEDMDLDHIVPRTRGGQDQWRNFQLLCRNCNTGKGGKGMTEWSNYLMQKRMNAEAEIEKVKMQEKIDELQRKREERK